MQKTNPGKLEELGETLDEFNGKLKEAAKNFQKFLSKIKREEGWGTLDGM
jgi:hypothetical protein